jgi:uncharacterized protein (DUF488 family)
MNTLYTLGYQGWTPDAITMTVRDLEAVLLDIRLNPTSPHPQWRRGAFESRLGRDYLHAGGFGNVNYRTGGPVELKDPEAYIGAVQHLLEAMPVILMCGCRDHTQCHRTVAAHYIRDALGGVEIVHLYPDTL